MADDTKRMNVLYSSDDNYAQHMRVSNYSLLRHNAEFENIRLYVIDNDISPANKDKLREMVSRFSNAEIMFLPFLEWKEKLRLNMSWDISISSYARLFMGEMLPETVDRVLYADCDMIVCEPLRELWNTPLDGITRNTGKVIRGIIGLAGKEQPVFGKSEVVILLTMRNNRRLLQNAEACVDGLSRLHITDNGQAAAYLWMILQPWISFDSFAYALMDEEQLHSMEKLAERMPQTLAKLKGIDFPLETEELPTILMKTFILRYE